MKVFVGYDPREAAGLHVFWQSLVETSPGAALIPLTGPQGDGSNAFTYQRFRVPEMCCAGPALFMDGSDMLLRAHVAELFGYFNPRYAVQVVKHDYRTRNQRKYVGTEMECANLDYPRKNWSSVVLWNCGHWAHYHAREHLRAANGALHRFDWLRDEEIGELPAEWNWLADEYGPNGGAKLLHWTAGIPGFTAHSGAPHADEWLATAARARRGMQ